MTSRKGGTNDRPGTSRGADPQAERNHFRAGRSGPSAKSKRRVTRRTCKVGGAERRGATRASPSVSDWQDGCGEEQARRCPMKLPQFDAHGCISLVLLGMLVDVGLLICWLIVGG